MRRRKPIDLRSKSTSKKNRAGFVLGIEASAA
jgi:hypothetical protein